MSEAAMPEPIPVGNGEDVGNAAAALLRKNGYEKVAVDLESRIDFGEKKYGTRLKTNNGRNCLMDSYQEVSDFLNYSMQGHLEGIDGCLDLFNQAMTLAAKVRRMLDGETDL